MPPDAPATLRHVPAVYRARLRLVHCCVCRRPREADQTFRSLLCGRRSCAQVYRGLRARRRLEDVKLPLPPKGLPNCSVCDWPLTPPELDRTWPQVSKGLGVCGDAACRKVWKERRRAEAEAAARDARRLTERLARHRDAVAERSGVGDPQSYPVVRLPANSRRLTNLPERKRRRFRDFLYRLIAQAVLPPPDGEEPSAALPEVPPKALPGIVQACTLCRGNCCFDGTDHAHLRVEDIRRHMARHPEQRPRDVHAAFMERIGRRTYEDSCLFHGERGCELGELRGLICRRHFCDGLLAFQQDVAEGAPPRACLVSLGRGILAHYAPGQRTTSAIPIAGSALVADDARDPTGKIAP